MDAQMSADLIKLNSVGAFISTDGIVRPMLDNNLPDMTDDGGHVNDSCPEWFEALSAEDANTVQWIIDDINRWEKWEIHQKIGNPQQGEESQKAWDVHWQDQLRIIEEEEATMRQKLNKEAK